MIKRISDVELGFRGNTGTGTQRPRTWQDANYCDGDELKPARILVRNHLMEDRYAG